VAATATPATTTTDLILVLSRLKLLLLIWKRYKSPGSDQIPAELIEAGGDTLWFEIHKLLILFGIRKNYLIIGRSLLL
jgi:hypothetical protein